MKELKEMEIAVNDFNEAIDSVVTTMRARASGAMKPEHGSPQDRGSADAYYQRVRDPHFYIGKSIRGIRVSASEMTEAQIKFYDHGYNTEQDRKDYG